MNLRSALRLAPLLLIGLAAYSSNSLALPRSVAPSDEPLPQNPAPSIFGATDLAPAEAFRSAFTPGRNEVYPPVQSATSSCDCGAMETQPRRIAFTLTTYGWNGDMATDVPRTVGTPNPPIGSANWAPRRLYGPLISGFKLGHRKIDGVFTGKFLSGVPSSLRGVLRLEPSSTR